eukprot:SAG31_NODE_7354_length_1711_cov_11.980110_2_plen_275_part_00
MTLLSMQLPGPLRLQTTQIKMRRGLASEGGIRTCFYDQLGLKPGAAHKDIKEAYRRLALLHHPDRQQQQRGLRAQQQQQWNNARQRNRARENGFNPAKNGTTGNFVAIANAFATLGHPSRRATYDRDHRHPAPVGPGVATRKPSAPHISCTKQSNGLDLERMTKGNLVDLLAQLAEEIEELQRDNGRAPRNDSAASVLQACVQQQQAVQNALRRKRGRAGGQRIRRTAAKSVQRMGGRWWEVPSMTGVHDTGYGYTAKVWHQNWLNGRVMQLPC